MHNYFQHMDRKQVLELKQIVTAILEQPINLALPKLDIDKHNNAAVCILQNQLEKRNTIIVQFANMAIAALDEVSRRIVENEDLKSQYQQLAHKNKQDFMHLYQVKYENQQLKFHNFQLLAKNQQLSEERDSLINKLQGHLSNFEHERNKWRIQTEKLNIELQKLERINSFRKQNQEYTSKLKIQLMQLSTNNQKLKHELHATRKKLDIAFEQLETTKSKIQHLPSVPLSHYRDICGSVEILEEPETEEVLNDSKRRSSIKYDLQHENIDAPRLHHINKQWSLDQSVLTQENQKVQNQENFSFMESQGCLNTIKQKNIKIDSQQSQKRMRTVETCEQKQQQKQEIRSTADRSFNGQIQIAVFSKEGAICSSRYSREEFQKNFKKQRSKLQNEKLEQLKFSKISRIKFLAAVLGKQKDDKFVHQKKEKFLKESKQRQKQRQIEFTKFRNKIIDKKCTASTSFFTMTRNGSNASSAFSICQHKC